MFTRPDDLEDPAVIEAVASGWGLAVDDVAYAPVGFGSHHWRASGGGQRWFVTVDDLDARKRDAAGDRQGVAARLAAALATAQLLRSSGLQFVIAPELTLDGDVLHAVNDRYVAALYRHVDGTTHEWGAYESRAERLAVLDRLVDIHGSAPSVRRVALTDDFAIPCRDQLEATLTHVGTDWGPGPFAEGARELFSHHGSEVETVLARYDSLAAEVARTAERFVVTHGEPHRANTIGTADGVVLIDWDTALLAPPERDLWMLLGEDPELAAVYTERAGVAVQPGAVELYRLWWDLCEISLYTAQFQAPHIHSEDTQTAWDGLQQYLDPSRWHT